MNKIPDKCPLCGETAEVTLVGTQFRVGCDRCGRFRAAYVAFLAELPGLGEDERAQISTWTRRRADRGEDAPCIVQPRYERGEDERLVFEVEEILAASYPRTVPERLDAILLEVGRRAGPGKHLRFSADDRFLYFSKTAAELDYYLSALDGGGLIEFPDVKQVGRTRDHIGFEGRVTPDGWAKITRLAGGGIDTKRVFVAMSFHSDLLSAWLDGIKKGVQEAEFDPYRVDRDEYNDKIDDKIVAEIRRSRFLVADVTLHRQGVYFEAGYAMGLGLPVIWTCRDDALGDCHFDTRQYNYVVWSDPADLAGKLEIRIRATI